MNCTLLNTAWIIDMECLISHGLLGPFFPIRNSCFSQPLCRIFEACLWVKLPSPRPLTEYELFFFHLHQSLWDKFNALSGRWTLIPPLVKTGMFLTLDTKEKKSCDVTQKQFSQALANLNTPYFLHNRIFLTFS